MRLGGLGVFGGGREGPVGFLWEWENGGVWSLKTRTPLRMWGKMNRNVRYVALWVTQ